MSRKTALTILIILSVLGIGFLIFNLFFNNPIEESGEVNDNIRNPFGDFFPTENIDNINEDDSNVQNTGDFNTVIPKLRQVTSVPTAGHTLYTEEVEELFGTTTQLVTENIIRYVERATGHIYETKTNSFNTERLSNTTIPKTFEVKFFNDPNKLIYRYIDATNEDLIKSYLAELNEVQVSTTTSTSTEEYTGDLETEINLTGVFLDDNIDQLDVSESGNIYNLFISNLVGNTKSLIYTYTESTLLNPDLVLNSEISQINTEWINNNEISVTTKPSYIYDGYSYILNTNTGILDKILGPEVGLTTKYSSDGNMVIYSVNNNGNTETYIKNISTNEILSPNFKTITDKCTWDNDSVEVYCAIPRSITGDFPDVWYQGVYSFNDSIISYNTETRNGSVYYIDGDINQSLDVINLKLSDDETFLLFQNKKDLSLWILDLN